MTAANTPPNTTTEGGWIARIMRREPDFHIGGREAPYIRRWWVIPRNRWFNIYLHEILRSDDDRALHDHPWVNCSILLAGRYIEHTIADGGIEIRKERGPGAVVMRGPGSAHRLEILPGERAVSLFITGPRVRNWGFHCPKAGWVRWEQFVAADDKGAIGRGCGEQDA